MGADPDGVGIRHKVIVQHFCMSALSVSVTALLLQFPVFSVSFFYSFFSHTGLLLLSRSEVLIIAQHPRFPGRQRD